MPRRMPIYHERKHRKKVARKIDLRRSAAKRAAK